MPRMRNTENERNSKVIKAKIKEIEEEMNKPKLLAASVFHFFERHKNESLTGEKTSGRMKVASEMWQALTEEERKEYKAKWHKLKAEWQTDVVEWEERNADNPKMMELKAYKVMLETAKNRGSF